jgi:hypothetical protein
MKLAVCFSGDIRFIKECYNNIYEYILKNNEVDVYAHLWWDNKYQGKIFRFHSDHTFENEDLGKLFLDYYKPQIKFPDVYTGTTGVYANDNNPNHNILFGQINYFGLLSQYYSKMKVNELCEKSGIKYDSVIHLRVDCVIDDGRYITETLKNINYKENIFICSTMNGGPKYCGHHPNEPSDWFFIGPQNKITTYVNMLYNLLRVYRKHKVFHIKDYIIQVFKDMKEPSLYIFDSGTSVYRPLDMFPEQSKFIHLNYYYDNFDFNKLEWVDLLNKYLPYYSKYMNFKEFFCKCGNNEFNVIQNSIENMDDIYRIIECNKCKHSQIFPSI